MSNSPFPLQREPLAVALINTYTLERGRRVDLLQTTKRLDAWLDGQSSRLHSRPKRVSHDDLARVRQLRDDVRVLVEAKIDGTSPPMASVRRVNQAARAGRTWEDLVWTESGPELHRNASVTGIDAVLGAVAHSVVEVVTGPDGNKLKKCEGPNCVLIFVAQSSRRRWCDPSGCGNRVRVQRHYQRATET